MIFATVANRDPLELERGLLDVRFLDGVQAYNYFRRSDGGPVCDMVECPSYFEAYKHVLEGLKEIDTLSMEEFIVKGWFLVVFSSDELYMTQQHSTILTHKIFDTKG